MEGPLASSAYLSGRSSAEMEKLTSSGLKWVSRNFDFLMHVGKQNLRNNFKMRDTILMNLNLEGRMRSMKQKLVNMEISQHSLEERK